MDKKRLLGNRVSVSQGSSPVRRSSFTISPGTQRILRNRFIAEKPANHPTKKQPIKRSRTSEQLFENQELGKDVPIEIALKRVLVCAQRGDWSGCEQAIRAVEQHEEERASPLEGLVDPASGNTPLMYAAMENKIALMERIIALGSALSATNKARMKQQIAFVAQPYNGLRSEKKGFLFTHVEGYNVIHFAMMHSRLDTINFLLGKKEMAGFFQEVAGPKAQSSLHLVASRVASQQSAAIVKELSRRDPTSVAKLRLQADGDGNIPLLTAIDSGNMPLCQELLANEQIEEQMSALKKPLKDTILHLAVRRRDPDMLKFFIESGCPVDKANIEGQTALHLAALVGDENLIRILFMARADSSICDHFDRTPVYLAAERGHTLAVEFLADKFKSSVFTRAKDGSTLLHVAALNGHSETAMVLHRRGVPLLMPNSNGARGIHVAAQKGHVGVLNAIIARGENVNALTNSNISALHLAVEAGNPEVVECLLGNGADVHIKGGEFDEMPLHMACRKGEARGEKCAKMLLKSGANPNFPMSDGRTPLHIAATKPATSRILKLLLENGADISKEDLLGETALFTSIKHCNFRALKVLLEVLRSFLGDCGSFISHENKVGETGMHLACKIHKGQLHFPREDIQIVELLLKHGGGGCVLKLAGDKKETAMHYVAETGNADILEVLFDQLDAGQVQLCVNMQSAIGWSPLCTASAQCHLKCVDLILKNHGRVDVFDHEGRSPLHLAAETGGEDVCKSLLAANAFINSKTKAGWSALHFAAQKGHVGLVDLFIRKHGATVDSLTMKKQTPLHLAATFGQIEVCRVLVEFGASLDAADDNGQKAIHLAAQSNQAEVVLMLLETRPSLVSAMTREGNSCAHIAAKKGSTVVMEKLMKFDRTIVITARNKVNDSTALHIASEGGHRDLVKALLLAGASAIDETRQGNTPIHIAARNGHVEVLAEFAKHSINMRTISQRSGMSAIHMAALYGQSEAMRELLTHVPSHLKSELPASPSTSIVKEFANEADLTSLHLASFAGSDDAVRALLNSPSTVVEATTTPSKYAAIHFACFGGHIGVVGLLLSRATGLLRVEDAEGRTCLHVSASRGHYDMVQVLLGQGASITAKDKKGWQPLHHAAHAGFLDIVHLLMENGASSTNESNDGHIPLWLAAAANNFHVSTYLLRKDHDTLKLLGDRQFCYNLMTMGKANDNKCIEDFVFVSPAPCFTAALLSALFRDSALKEKDRAAELMQMGDVCEELNKDLLAIAANVASPGAILNSIDEESTSFIDTLIANDQKIAISQYVVQQYLQEIWQGHLQLSTWQFVLFFATFVLLPPIWFLFSLPVEKGLNRVPVVKFMAYLTSHLYFMAFLTLLCVAPPDSTARESMFPFWYEIVVWVWYLGLLLSQITNPGAKGGLSWVKNLLVLLGIISYVVHGVGVALDPSWYSFIIYIRNMFYGYSLLFATVLILDFLSFHHLFGPWAIIIGELLLDVGKFVVVLSLFIAGYSLLCTSMNLPFGFESDYPDGTNRSLSEKIQASTDVVQPFLMFEVLFFALFGFSAPKDLMISTLLQGWTIFAFKLVFASYLLLTVVVLVNLLIAMMSDTYQRIQQESDTEWKYGLAKLIRNMQRTQVAPSPLNLLTTWLVLLRAWCIKGKQDREIARQRFRAAIQDEISKAPGMKFSIGLTDEVRPTPRVIHALGNIKWGFSDGIRPLPVEKVQSKWDLEHEQKSRGGAFGGSTTQLDDAISTSKAVSWPKVIRRYLTLQGREKELKLATEHESSVVSIMRDIVDLKNDAVKEDTRPIAGKWSKVVADAQKQLTKAA